MSVVVSLLAAGCVNYKPAIGVGQVNSLQVVLHDPAADGLGSPVKPVTATQATFDVFAVDSNGAPVVQDLDVNAFVSFGGVKTGGGDPCTLDISKLPADPVEGIPIQKLHLTGGQLLGVTLPFPATYGATAVWLDEPLSHAAGASPTIYFHNPMVPDVQTPADPTASNATICSPFNGKFVTVDHATTAPTGTSGQLVVTSVFGQAFAVTDTGASAYNSIYLYAFGKPPPYIVPGRVLSDFSGNYSKFFGFTELNFPLFNAATMPDSDPMNPTYVPLATLPPPTVLAFADLASLPKLIGLAAGVVSYTGTICDPNPPNPTKDPNIQIGIDQWIKFNQFIVDNDGTCAGFTNVSVQLPSKTLGGFDPLQNVGKTLTVVGMLQNHSGQKQLTDPATGQALSCTATQPCMVGGVAKGVCIQGECYKNAYNFWNVEPRAPEDIVSIQ